MINISQDHGRRHQSNGCFAQGGRSLKGVGMEERKERNAASCLTSLARGLIQYAPALMYRAKWMPFRIALFSPLIEILLLGPE